MPYTIDARKRIVFSISKQTRNDMALVRRPGMFLKE